MENRLTAPTQTGGPADSAAQGIFAGGDTLDDAADLPIRLEIGERALAAMGDSGAGAAEVAGRWRRIGDLWEWLGRRDESPAFFARALMAYENGIRIDPSAGTPDSSRIARARAGAAGAPNPARTRE
jgi:hypothetical protein